ncbi:MAG: beta-ketoacyl-ACP synthase III [Azoarcus sp.]|nr:beta-ketoacyl-ACP synthase III [Azoarcus sp.]
MTEPRNVFITATATCLPNAPVGNEDIEAVLGRVGGRPSRARRIVLRNNGIVQRHYAIDPATGEATHNNAQLTAEAVRGLVGDDFALEHIECLVTGTSLPDQLMPNHGVMVHGELGNPACEVVSTAGICLAGLTALKYAWLSVLAGNSHNAIATGSDLPSVILRGEQFEAETEARVAALEAQPEIAFEKDFLRWMLSDGAGAFLLQSTPRASGRSLRIDWIELSSQAHTQPACMYAGGDKDTHGRLRGWALHTPQAWGKQSIFAIKQDVRLLNENVVAHTLEAPLRALIAKRGLASAQIDWFLPHMSSHYFRQPIADCLAHLGLPIAPERWFTNLATKGNTGAASIYIMIDELLRSGRLAAGQRLLCFVPESGRFSSGFVHLTVV